MGRGARRGTRGARFYKERRGRRGGAAQGLVDGLVLSALSRWGETRGEWLTGPWTRTRWLTVLVDRGGGANGQIVRTQSSQDSVRPTQRSAAASRFDFEQKV